MKTKFWILLFCALFLVCAAASVFLLLPCPASDFVTVISDGKTIAQLPLSEDTELTVRYANGYNTVTVANGKVCVTAASCPDRHCMHYGEKNSGLPIICLPNHLILQFSNRGSLDGITR